MGVDDLGARARKVLHAVVAEYLATGEAVGSQTVATRHGLEVSPATVRNVMGDLEERGLLKHTHTSAGRIPTERGLRYYVDTLLRVRSLSCSEKDEIRGKLTGAPGADPAGVPEVMQRTSRLLRELSHLTVVVQAPRPEGDVLEHIEFVRLRENQLLAVLVTASGQIQNKMVRLDAPLPPSELDRINGYLNSLVAGVRLDEVRARVAAALESERAARDGVAAMALRLAAVAVPQARGGEVLVDGQSNLLSSETDVEQAKLLLRTLEEKETLLHLLDRTIVASGIRVFIGADANLADLSDVSVVATSYGIEGHPLGTIGVIGPARMNYSRVIPLVDFTAEMVTELLGKS